MYDDETMISVTVRLPRTMRARLKQLANAARRSESEVLRLLIETAPLPTRPDILARPDWPRGGHHEKE